MRTARTLYFSVLVLAMGVLLGQGSHYLFGQDPEPPSAQRSHSMQLNLNIGGKVLTATLVDNATARDFVSVLPLSVSMNDLFGREKYGDLPKALSENGPKKSRYEVGDIAYWSPDNQFAVYYHQDGKSIPSPGIIPIARIDNGVEAFDVPDSVKVTIELAK
jgi:hypothetical protein